MAAVDEVEDWVLASLDPLGSLDADEPVEVVVPAVPPEPVWDDPLADVEVEAEPLPLPVEGELPVGLDELDWLFPVPVEDWPELDVPAPVLAVPEPDPWAALEPLPVGFVWVFEPVPVVASPVGVVEPPAVALEELPVEAEADEPPPDPEFAEVEELVLVVALAEPPVAVVVGVGVGEVGLGVGAGEVGLGVGAGEVAVVGLGVGVEPAVPVHQ